MNMFCDNQLAINNIVFHERTKHIKVDYHIFREAVMSKQICTLYTKIEEQLVDIFTKALGSTKFQMLYNKLGMINIFALS